MTDLNVVTVVGRLTRDCGQQEFTYLQNGNAVAKISIAVNRSKKQNDGSWVDEASFFDVAIFGRTAENLHPYLLKGKQIAVKGYLKQDRWQDKQTGENRSKVSIIAEEVQLIGGQSQNNNGGNFQQAPQVFNGNVPQYTTTAGNVAPQNPVPQPQGFAEDIPWDSSPVF